MSYNSLPSEIILQIVNIAPPASLRSIALVDKRTHKVAFKRLEERQKRLRNARTLSARFDTPYSPIRKTHLLNRDIQALRPDLVKKYFPASARPFDHGKTGPVLDLEYLGLNGDLHWLQDVGEELAKQHDGWPRGHAGPREKLMKLEDEAKRLGLVFPEGFIRLMGDEELVNRIFLGGHYITLADEFVKCNPCDDKDSGGYVIRFVTDQQGVCYWSLYLTPSGQSCVVWSIDDVHCYKCSGLSPYGDRGWGPWEGHPKYPKDNGVAVPCDDLKLEFRCGDWEEWLATKYFQGWSSEGWENGLELGEGLKEFVREGIR